MMDIVIVTVSYTHLDVYKRQVVMGLEKITFGWYMKHISWIAFVGYIAGIVCYWFIRTFLYAV